MVVGALWRRASRDGRAGSRRAAARELGGLAAAHEWHRVVDLLEDDRRTAGNDVNAVVTVAGGGWHTLLHAAAKGGRVEAAYVLLSKGADVDAVDALGRDSLMAAAEAGFPAVCGALLDAGADVAAQNPVNGMTALHYAARASAAEWCGEILLRHGAAINAEDHMGQTPLHIAAAQGAVPACRALLAHGANVAAAENSDGCTPLDFALAEGALECAELLLAAGATLLPPNPERIEGDSRRNPLHFAASRNRSDVLHFVLEHAEGDTNTRNADGDAPLHIAARSGFVRAVRTLLEHDADPTMLNHAGETPLDTAMANQNATTAAILEPYEA